MFERFTERARQVAVLAQEEADTLKHNYIGTEHILLGLLREKKGLAAQVLESPDITVERARDQVVRIVRSGEEVTSGQIPFTPRALTDGDVAVDVQDGELHVRRLPGAARPATTTALAREWGDGRFSSAV